MLSEDPGSATFSTFANGFGLTRCLVHAKQALDSTSPVLGMDHNAQRIGTSFFFLHFYFMCIDCFVCMCVCLT